MIGPPASTTQISPPIPSANTVATTGSTRDWPRWSSTRPCTTEHRPLAIVYVADRPPASP